MTRYMLILRSTPEAEKAMENVDFNEVIADMGRYNEELIKAGVLLAGEGLAVLMITSEMEEIVEGSDRVFVLRDGRTVAEFGPQEISQDTIITIMAEGHEDSVAAPEEA